MKALRAGFLCLILVFGLLFVRPVVSPARAEPGISRAAMAPLDDCQNRFANTLKFLEREREYAVEKGKYHEALSRRCAAERWYDFGLLDCAIFVPLFGLILPFFGLTIINSLRSRSRKSSQRAIDSSPPAGP